MRVRTLGLGIPLIVALLAAPFAAEAQQGDAAARALGVRLHAIRLSGPSDLDAAFAKLKRDRIDALGLHGYVATLQNRQAIVECAAANGCRRSIQSGNIMSMKGACSLTGRTCRRFRRSSSQQGDSPWMR